MHEPTMKSSLQSCSESVVFDSLINWWCNGQELLYDFIGHPKFQMRSVLNLTQTTRYNVDGLIAIRLQFSPPTLERLINTLVRLLQVYRGATALLVAPLQRRLRLAVAQAYRS